MDGLSAAASVLAVGSAGIKISIKLVAFANQVKTAGDVAAAIGKDVCLTAGVLHELGELMRKKKPNQNVGIFSDGALRTTQALASTCQDLFAKIEDALGKANRQMAKRPEDADGPVVLSTRDRLKWPFSQPDIERLRMDLEKTKTSLMLMLQIVSLGYSKALAPA